MISPTTEPPPPEAASSVVVGRAGWRLQVHSSLHSTSDLAAKLPPWSAVVADSQTGGRGRYGRTFVSAPGGLWISAVVPTSGSSALWNGFSLTVGLHLLRTLGQMGVAGVRLRWPNDLMSSDRKLGGLLLEQGLPDCLVLGLGLNVHNRPWEQDPALESLAVRLADLLPRCPDPSDLAPTILDSLADAHESHLFSGLDPTIEALNEHWSRTRVRLLLHDAPPLCGTFLGLDPSGNLLLELPDSTLATIPHHHVQKLTET